MTTFRDRKSMLRISMVSLSSFRNSHRESRSQKLFNSFISLDSRDKPWIKALTSTIKQVFRTDQGITVANPQAKR